MVGLWFLGSPGRNTGPESTVSFFSARKPPPQGQPPLAHKATLPPSETPKPNRAVRFAGAGERRPRASSFLLAWAAGRHA